MDKDELGEKVNDAMREQLGEKLLEGCKLLYKYYESLVEVGFSKEQAINLTGVYLRYVLQKPNNKEG